MREKEVLLDNHVGEEIEVHQGPNPSPEIQRGEKCCEGDQVHHYQTSVRPLLHRAVRLDYIIGSENHCSEDEGNEDAVPGFKVLDDDLTRLEDEVIFQLPHRPPAADDEAVDDEVAEDGVQYDVCWVSAVSGATEVTVGGEDIGDAVSDYHDWGASCAFKCIHGKKRDGGQEEDCEKLEPLHAGEDYVESVETPNPEDNSEKSIIVNDNNF